MAEPTGPNVLLVHAHDLGKHLGCYGRDVDSPRIDALADESMQFTNHFCSAPQCGPSRSSIMTGMHPHRNGLMGHYWLGWGLHDHVTTLPQTLSDAGYSTHVFGVQHLGPDPEALGYDTAFPPSDEAAFEGSSRASKGHITDAAVELIRDRAEDETPFFASVGFFETHRLGFDERFQFDDGSYDCPDPDEVEPLPYLPDRPGIREDLAGIGGSLRTLDGAVGEVIDTVDEAGIRDETLLIFTTDHGLAMPRAKGTCHDPGLETALLARHPDFGTGTRDELLSNVDLFPTIADYLGIEMPNDPDGRSFLPLLTGNGAYAERERIYGEMTFHDKYNPVRSVRTNRYKYIRTFDDQPLVYLPYDILYGPAGQEMFWQYYGEGRPEEELYDLETDPHEQENLIGEPEYAGIATELRSDVEMWMAETDDPLVKGDVNVPDEHVTALKRYPWTG